MSNNNDAPEDAPGLACILCCERPRLAQWQLPLRLPPDASVTLLGWVSRPAAVDAGPPEAIARVLAEVLTQHARVSFPAGAPRQRGLLHRWFSRPNTKKADWVHTRDPERARQLFAAPDFDWCLRATAAFLSPPDGPVPALGLEDVEDALAGRAYDGWRARGIAGLVAPGVDGQVLGMYAFDATTAGPWKHRLCEAARRHGVEWRDLDEDAFARALAGGA